MQEKEFQFVHEDLVHALNEECSPKGVSITKIDIREIHSDNSAKNLPELSRAQYKIETSVKLEVGLEEAFEFSPSPFNFGLTICIGIEI